MRNSRYHALRTTAFVLISFAFTILLSGCMDAIVPKTCYHDTSYQHVWVVDRDTNAVFTAVSQEIAATEEATVVLSDRREGIATWRESTPDEWTDIWGQSGFSLPEDEEAFYLTTVHIQQDSGKALLTIKRVVISEESVSVTGAQDGVSEREFVDRALARIGIEPPASPEKE